MRLGILDFGSILQAETPDLRLRHAVRTAQVAEAVGVDEFWVAEHGTPSSAWTDALSVLGHVARVTTTLRLGTAGVLLADRDPVDVARAASLLRAEFGDRFEIGCAKGSSRPRSDVGELDAVFEAKFRALDERKDGAPLWLMANSPRSVMLALETGAGCGMSAFHKDGFRAESVELLRTRKQRASRVLVAVAGSVIDPARSSTLSQNPFVRRSVVAAVDTLAAALVDAGTRCGADTVLFMDIECKMASRLRNVQHLAAAFRALVHAGDRDADRSQAGRALPQLP